MSLHTWSWLFLIIYIVLMICFGLYASSKVSSADDFATARKGYGPFILALARSELSLHLADSPAQLLRV